MSIHLIKALKEDTFAWRTLVVTFAVSFCSFILGITYRTFASDTVSVKMLSGELSLSKKRTLLLKESQESKALTQQSQQQAKQLGERLAQAEQQNKNLLEEIAKLKSRIPSPELDQIESAAKTAAESIPERGEIEAIERELKTKAENIETINKKIVEENEEVLPKKIEVLTDAN